MFLLPKNGGRPQAGEWWYTSLEGIKGVKVRADVRPLDEFVECDIYKAGSDEPLSIQHEFVVRVSDLTEKVS